ncbi:MAG: hypothetical protein ACOYOF_01355 [Verrucomicrobiaceae bacterium]
MNLTEKLSGLTNIGRDLAQQQRDALIADAEQKLQAIADKLAARIERALMIAGGAIGAGLLILAGVLLVS